MELAVTAAGAQTLMLAKVDSARDIDEVRDVCLEAGGDPTFVASIESALGVLNAREILAHPSVVAATFGPGDLHVDAGMSLYEPDGSPRSPAVVPIHGARLSRTRGSHALSPRRSRM